MQSRTSASRRVNPNFSNVDKTAALFIQDPCPQNPWLRDRYAAIAHLQAIRNRGIRSRSYFGFGEIILAVSGQDGNTLFGVLHKPGARARSIAA